MWAAAQRGSGRGRSSAPCLSVENASLVLPGRGASYQADPWLAADARFCPAHACMCTLTSPLVQDPRPRCQEARGLG